MIGNWNLLSCNDAVISVWFMQEELIRVVGEYIDKARVAFPRLFFLSDNDLLSLLAWSRNPKDLLPFVRKCFPGIKNLQFALPRDGNVRLATSLDTALNGNVSCQNIYYNVFKSPGQQRWKWTLVCQLVSTCVSVNGHPMQAYISKLSFTCIILCLARALDVTIVNATNDTFQYILHFKCIQGRFLESSVSCSILCSCEGYESLHWLQHGGRG